MGRRAKYTPESWREACEAYFAEIEYEVPMMAGTEQILNRSGKPIMRVEYAVPPTLERLELVCGISDETWRTYSRKAGYRETCEWVRKKILAYEMEQVEILGRDGRGVQFKIEMELRRREREAEEEERGGCASASMQDRMEILADIAKRFAEEGKGASSVPELPDEDDDGG